jgi:hypothetical protein
MAALHGCNAYGGVKSRRSCPCHSERSAAKSKNPVALPVVWQRDPSTSLGMTVRVERAV